MKPQIRTGVQMLHGRAVIIQELDEPIRDNENPDFVYYFVVVELGRIEEKSAWLWDGLVEN